MNWYKKAQANIYYLGDFNFGGVFTAKFKVNDDFWAYRFSFPEQIEKIKQIARYSDGKAFAYAKKNKKDAFKVTEDWPSQDSEILREELSKEKEKKETQDTFWGD